MSFGFFKAPNFTANDGIVNQKEITAENLSVHGVIHSRGKDELDHTKWLVFATHTSSQKVQGYDAPERGSLTFEAEMSGRVKNLGKRPGSDFRLGCAAFNSIDMQSWMVFDFLITNTHVYALYERLPFGRTPQNNYASFTYVIPVLLREDADERHVLRIELRNRSEAVWSVGGKEVFKVSEIGRRLPEMEMALDHGGDEEIVRPMQLAPGFGRFTLVDAKINGAELAAADKELFGQDIEMEVFKLRIY